MTIQITRADPAGNIGTDSTEAMPLSQEVFETWEEAFASLRARSIPVTAEHEAQFRAHPDTQFSWNEFLNLGHTAYSCNVRYDVRVIE